MVAMDTFSNSINSMPSADTLKPNQTKKKKKFTTQDYSHCQSYRGKGEDRNRTEPETQIMFPIQYSARGAMRPAWTEAVA